MSGTIVVVLISAIGAGVASADPLYQLVLDARSANEHLYPFGSMKYRISDLVRPDKRPVSYRAEIRWSGDDAVWSYWISDPDQVHYRDFPSRADGEGESFRAFKKDKKILTYTVLKNTLGITALREPFSVYPYLEVTPKALWSRCCAPSHTESRPWAEMIGPNSPTLSRGGSMAIERVGADLVRQTRSDPDGGRLVITFSLALSGNVVEQRYHAADPAVQSIRTTYAWHKIPDGRSVLDGFLNERMAPGSETKVVASYRMTVDEIDVVKSIVPAMMTYEAFKASLPHDVYVLDRIKNKDYYLNRVVETPSAKFGELAEEIARRGFLQPRR